MKTVAAFDFDGTITTKDTLWEFLKFSQKKGQLIIGFVCLSPILGLYLLKLIPNYKAKEKLFRWFFKGWSLTRFDEVCSAFSSKINQLIRPEILALINKHKDNQDAVIIISASIENWINPWADTVKMEMVLATRIEVDSSGKLTGRFLSKNCYGAEKVNRLLEYLPQRESYFLYAYGDSRGDKELIQFADNGTYVQQLKKQM